MVTFFPKSEDAKKIISNQKTKIKFEIDTDNPTGGKFETKYRFLPAPYDARMFDESSLFAGKIHAVICRNCKNHVKGRDYYDYLFYIGKGSKLNLTYLENKLKYSKVLPQNEKLTLEKVKDLLKAKFEVANYELAKEDVMNFIPDKSLLNLWKKELFVATLACLRAD